MPELPEVETTRAAISPYIKGEMIERIEIRCPRLRYPISQDLNNLVKGQQVKDLGRRAKYLIMDIDNGWLLIHLGMSGHLRILPALHAAGKHDHVDLCFGNGVLLRYNDPRRFGFWLYFKTADEVSYFLRNLGPEPLSESFDGDYLYKVTRKRTQPIKSLLMNNHFIVGVGNIYASESLFFAKIHPLTPSQALTLSQCNALVAAVKKVLAEAITAGGTTLKDFVSPEGKLGYFVNNLQVYGRKNKECPVCEQRIKVLSIAGRSSCFCPGCQQL